MIFIKSKKQYLLGILVVLICITIYSPTILAYDPPYTSRKPYYHYTYAGDETDGDTGSFRYAGDGDIIKWEGEWGSFGRLGVLVLYGYCIKFSTFFDDPGSSYKDNSVTLRYKFNGQGNFGMLIYYVGSGTFYVNLPSTGGSLAYISVNIGDHRVYGIAFGAVRLYGQVFVDVDYLIAKYEY